MKLKLRIIAAVAATMLFLGGCATNPAVTMDLGYKVGDTVNANVGQEFLSATYGQYKVVTAGQQFAQAMNGQVTHPAGSKVYSPDFMIKDLVYSGRRGDVITVDYREYRTVNKIAAPSFFQTVEYDLNESKEIYFRNFGFRVIEATNRQIKAVIITD